MPYFDRSKQLPLTIDLNQKITPKTLRAILETANRYDDQQTRRITVANPGREGILQNNDDVAAGDGRRHTRRSDSTRYESTGDNLSGNDTTDARRGIQATERGTETSQAEHRGAISGQDNAGVDSNQPRALPAGETVTRTAESEISSSTRFRRESAAAAYEAEIQSIIDQAKANGTYLKAPNGKSTLLSERQWAQVRTRAFKRWFGDWEKAARIDKLRRSEPVAVEFNDEYALDRKSAKEWAKNNIRGKYVNKDTGETIEVSRMGIDKVTSHGEREADHLKSVVAIPALIENSVFIEEASNEKGSEKYDAYRYYVCGLTLDGADYTAKIVVGLKDGKRYYDHRLTVRYFRRRLYVDGGRA